MRNIHKKILGFLILFISTIFYIPVVNSQFYIPPHIPSSELPYISITPFDFKPLFVGERFELKVEVFNPGKTPLYNVTVSAIPSRGLVLVDDDIVKIVGKIEPNNSYSFNFSIGAINAGKSSIEVQYSYTASYGKQVSRPLTFSYEIVNCDQSDCPTLSWAWGKHITFGNVPLDCSLLASLDITYLEPNKTTEKVIQTSASFKIPSSDYRDLITHINTFDVDVLSKNRIKVTLEFFLRNKSNPGISSKTKISKNSIFLDYNISNQKSKNLLINGNPIGKKEPGYFYVCSHETLTSRGFSAINIYGETLDYPLETEKTYLLTFELENVFQEIATNRYRGKIGVFLPTTQTILSEASVRINGNFTGNASLIQWTDKSLIKEKGDVAYLIMDLGHPFQNEKKLDYILVEDKERNSLRLNIEAFRNFKFEDYALLEYDIVIWEKPQIGKSLSSYLAQLLSLFIGGIIGVYLEISYGILAFIFITLILVIYKTKDIEGYDNKIKYIGEHFGKMKKRIKQKLEDFF